MILKLLEICLDDQSECHLSRNEISINMKNKYFLL